MNTTTLDNNRHTYVLISATPENPEGFVRLPGDDLYKEERCTHCGIVKRTTNIKGKSTPKYTFKLPGSTSYVSVWQTCEKRRYHATVDTQAYRNNGKPLVVPKGTPASVHEVQALAAQTKQLAGDVKQIITHLQTSADVEPTVAIQPITSVTPSQVAELKHAFTISNTPTLAENLTPPTTDRALLQEALMLLSWLLKDLNFVPEAPGASYPARLAKAFIQRPHCADLMTQSLTALNANPSMEALLQNLFAL